MQFLQLYGDELDRELGSADRTQLFTTARRKAAINAAQLEWLERTECFQREVGVSLSDAVQEYDLEATITNFGWLAKEGVSIWIVSGTNVQYIEGNCLPVTTMERLNAEHPGWRATPAGTPQAVYTRREAGTIKLGFWPAPSIASGDVWVALVHAVILPTDLSADTDVPYTYSADAITSLAPYHRALVHFAAYDLEKLRMDPGREQAQLQLFESYVSRYLMRLKPKGGQVVRFARNYRRPARRLFWGDDTVVVQGSSSSSSSSTDLTVLATATEPTSPSEGQVWFFNADPDFGIKEWISGAWVTLYTTTVS